MAPQPQLLRDSGSFFPTSGIQDNSIPTSIGDRKSSKPLKAANCECLERHADLLLRFKDLQAQQNPRIDVLLVFAKKGIEAWQSVITCSYCQENDNQEVLMLTAMSIRIYVRSLRRLSLDDDSDFTFDTAHSGLQKSPSSRNSPHLPMNGAGNTRNARDQRASDYRRGPAATNSQDTSTHGSPNNTSNARTQLGMFEITGTDHKVIVKVMLSRTLQQIQIVLAGLKQRAGSEKFWQGSPSHQGQRYRHQLDLEQVRRMGFMSDEKEIAEFTGDLEGNTGKDENEMSFMFGLLNDLEAMVLRLRRDLQVELNPALDSAGAPYY